MRVSFLLPHGVAARTWCVLAMCVVVGLGDRSATAQSGDVLPLVVEVAPESFTSRTLGPIPFALNLEWAGSGLLEGTVVASFHDDSGQRLGILRLPDQYLAPGRHRIESILPPYLRWSEQVDVHLAIETPQGTYALTRHDSPQLIRIPGATKRTLVVTFGGAQTKLNLQHRRKISDWLAVEMYQPEHASSIARRGAGGMTTLVSHADVEDFPRTPLWHCVRDLVVLSVETLSQLDEQQVIALEAWTRAGGSLCLFQEEGRLEPWHTKLINAVTRAPDDAPYVVTSSGGDVSWYGPLADLSEPLPVEFGLGRVLFCPPLPANASDIDFATKSWRLAAAFLWKVRQVHLERMGWKGEWDLAYQSSNNQRARYGYTSSDEMQVNTFTSLPITGGTSLVGTSLPQSMQLVPLWLVGTLLLLYIAAVGPGDYWFLGLFAARRFTWILFPVITIGFTGFFVWLSHWYMSVTEHRGQIVIRDVVEGGVVARENRIETMLSNSPRVMVSPYTHAIVSPVRFQDFGGDNNWRMRQMERTGRVVDPPIYEGRMPTETTLYQRLPQWVPQLNRVLRIPRVPLEESSGFDWDAPIDWSVEGRRELAARLQGAFGSGVTAHAYRASGRDMSDVHGSAMPRARQAKFVICGDPWLVSSPEENQYVPRINAVGQQEMHWSRVDFLVEASIRLPQQFFSVVSQVSPMGGGRFEDLAIHDSTDSDSWLLIVAVDGEKDERIYYRRVYRSADGTSATALSR